MASSKPTNRRGRVTNQQVLDMQERVLSSIDALHSRDDHTNSRIDTVLQGQTQLTRKISGLEIALGQSVTELRSGMNDALHEMGVRVTTLERPWKFLLTGWRLAFACISASAAITGLAVAFEPWRFFS